MRSSILKPYLIGTRMRMWIQTRNSNLILNSFLSIDLAWEFFFIALFCLGLRLEKRMKTKFQIHFSHIENIECRMCCSYFVWLYLHIFLELQKFKPNVEILDLRCILLIPTIVETMANIVHARVCARSEHFFLFTLCFRLTLHCWRNFC